MPGLFCAQFSMRVPSVSARFSTLDTAVFVFSLSGTRSQSKRGRKRGERQRFPSPPPQKTRGNHSSHEPSLNLAPTSLSTFTTAASAPSASATPTRLDPNSGRNLDGPDLSCPHPSGLLLPNPFVIGSGPPGTNRAVMRRAFLEGWGAVIAKTVSLDASKVFNVSPRYSKIKSRITGELIGWENIELISDRPFETMVRGRGRRGSCFGTLRFSSTFPFFDLSFLLTSLFLSLSFLAPRPSSEQQLDDFKRLKDEFPDRVLIASIMEEYSEERWLELVERVEVEGGVDAIEINFSCPHGMPGEWLKVFFFRGA